ncbi:MAG TPA: GNAT family N-acetyltransferase [Longimicrobium sp.]|nr:GNAT family N-acetyltransferase [Longimicrobium sp.]
MSHTFFASEDLVSRKLDEPLPPPLDCGREMQNRFLRECAWRDQQEMVSVTYIYFATGIPVAFATVSMDTVQLGSRERPKSIPYRSIGAVKLLQLGVDRPFQGIGLGGQVLEDLVALAREGSKRHGCRYLTLDAQPDLVGWYQEQGFVINRVAQKQRVEAAIASGRPVEELAVSMRFDLIDR